LGWRRLHKGAGRPELLWYATLLLGACLLLLGLRSVRHTALFTVAALPLIAWPGVWRPGALVQQRALVDARRGALHLLLGGLLAAVCLLALARELGDAPPEWQPLSPAIVAAVRSCPGTLFNSFDSGGPLLWFVPERAVFVDSREDPFPVDLLLNAALAEQQGAYHELFAKHGVACALVPVTRPIYQALRADRAWTELRRDEQLAVFRRIEAGGSGGISWHRSPLQEP
jgi:hypothetical protein